MMMVDVKQVVGKFVDNVALPPLILTGSAGIGKTQTVIDVCKEKGMYLEIIRVGSLDSPGDLLGLPEIKDGVTTFSEVEMFKRLENGGVLFLDEMNRCKPVLMDSIMQILDQKKLANYDLSHVSIIGAMNPDTDDYSVTEMDKAVVDRCLFIKTDNSLEAVIEYYQLANFDPRITELAILGEQHVKLNGSYKLPEKEMTPRGLRQLQSVLPIIDQMPEKVGLELLGACVGSHGVGTWKNKAILATIPTGKEFVDNPASYTEKVKVMETLPKRVLLNRINQHAKDNKPKDNKAFTEGIVGFGKNQIAYVIRNLKHIDKRLNTTNDQYATVAQEVIEAIS